MIARLLCERGVPPEDHERFLFPSYDRDCHDPFLFDDIPIAVSRITSALAQKERITIYGDYDVDGVSGAVILYDVLIKAGGDVSLFFNHREDDGYGLHCHCIDAIAAQGTRVMITTDSGIAQAKEIAYANTLGIDTIITDHHTPPQHEDEIPLALAIIHPSVHARRYPWKFLSGGGSAFKLAQALCRTFAEHDARWLHEEKWHLDLVALSIIADCVPLLGENRVLLQYGLRVIEKTRRPGLRALLARAPSFYRSSLLSTLHFGVIPLLNAASRMDHAIRAADVLIAPDDESASSAADILQSLNRERQRCTQKTIKSIPGNVLVNKNVFLAASPHWRIGVLGLAANRLLAQYHKPIILIREGSPSIGVARSTPDVHIAQTFARLSEYFDRFGGHRAAGGFALKPTVTIDEFAAACEQLDCVASTNESGAQHDRGTNDFEIDLADLTESSLHDLSSCAPWGPGNPQPRFLVRNCTISEPKPMGTRGQWVRMNLEQAGIRMSARARTSLVTIPQIVAPSQSDVLCCADMREWRGSQYVSLTIDAIIPALTA